MVTETHTWLLSLCIYFLSPHLRVPFGEKQNKVFQESILQELACRRLMLLRLSDPSRRGYETLNPSTPRGTGYSSPERAVPPKS
mmetsp:Transcript_8173/g.18960  ORF Transcript_8173/g.18960 Transcript_8173/m.18960 type:complete len:84 (+) Transcript_8173:492-743(+)